MSKKKQPAPPKERETVVQDQFLEDLLHWTQHDRRIAERVLGLMDHIKRDPFKGIGKPEPLKNFGHNAWSRRITEEHRIVYEVHDDKIVFLQARYHYTD